jgi:hypothetical protein
MNWMQMGHKASASLGLATLLVCFWLIGTADAQQTKLPACPADEHVRWDNCFGSYRIFDGGEARGEFRNNFLNGTGTRIWPNGQKYVGHFADGLPNGRGTLTSSDNSKYVGEFQDGKYHGQGILYSPNGAIIASGIWENGIFFRNPKSSQPGPPTAELPPPQSNSPSVTPPPPPPPATTKASSGTAFRIANGQFVTNHHVINGCTALKVEGSIGGRVIASDAIKDLALVSIANDSGPIASIRTTRPQLNETVTAAGFPLDGLFSGISITNGTISRLSGLQGDTGTLQISAPVQPGNSGGPLLDAAGNVIGVVSSRLDALKMVSAGSGIPQNVNFAISGNALRGFLDAKNVNYKEVGNERELTGVQIAARASAFTVLIECQR